MKKPFYIQSKICPKSCTNDLGMFFLFYEKIIWISYSKKRFLQIYFSSNTSFNWKKSFFRNELEIQKGNQHLISLIGFPDQKYSKIKFFIQKFQFKITHPIIHYYSEILVPTLFANKFSIVPLSKIKIYFFEKTKNLCRILKKNLFFEYFEEPFLRRKGTIKRKDLENIKKFTANYEKKGILFTNFFFKKHKNKKAIVSFMEKSFSKILIGSKFQICFFRYENFEIFVWIKKKKISSLLFNFFISKIFRELVFEIIKKKKITEKQNIFFDLNFNYFIKILSKNYLITLLSFFYQKSGKSFNLDFKL